METKLNQEMETATAIWREIGCGLNFDESDRYWFYLELWDRAGNGPIAEVTLVSARTMKEAGSVCEKIARWQLHPTIKTLEHPANVMFNDKSKVVDIDRVYSRAYNKVKGVK